MTGDDHFGDFTSSVEEAFARDPSDWSLRGTGFTDLLYEPLDDAHVRSAVFATFIAHGRRLAHSSALFRLMARPYANAGGLGDDDVVAGLTLHVDGDSALVAVPATLGDSSIIIDLGTRGVVVAAGADVRQVPASSLDPELVRVVQVDVGEARRLLGAVEASAAGESARSVGCLAAAMEILGAAEALLAIGVDHARSREQFGRPIAAFQAVRHLLALASLDIQAIRYLNLATLRTIGSTDTLPSSITKAVAGRNGRRVADRVCQVLGGTGFTWEHSFHGLHRRILVLDSLVIGSDDVMRHLGRTIDDGGDPSTLISLFAQAEAAFIDSRPASLA